MSYLIFTVNSVFKADSSRDLYIFVIPFHLPSSRLLISYFTFGFELIHYCYRRNKKGIVAFQPEDKIQDHQNLPPFLVLFLIGVQKNKKELLKKYTSRKI